MNLCHQESRTDKDESSSSSGSSSITRSQLILLRQEGTDGTTTTTTTTSPTPGGGGGSYSSNSAFFLDSSSNQNYYYFQNGSSRNSGIGGGDVISQELRSSLLLSSVEKRRSQHFLKTNNASVRELTINKLNYSFLEEDEDNEARILYGRETELSILREAYEDAKQGKQQKHQLVLISGSSGTGKTSVARRIQRKCGNDPEEGGNNNIVYAKCDFSSPCNTSYYNNADVTAAEPYSSMLDICRKICQIILVKGNKESTERLRNNNMEGGGQPSKDEKAAVEKKGWSVQRQQQSDNDPTSQKKRILLSERLQQQIVGLEMELLQKALPEINGIMQREVQNETTTTTTEDESLLLVEQIDAVAGAPAAIGTAPTTLTHPTEGVVNLDNKDFLQFAICRFLQLVALVYFVGEPLVIVVDDLQWSSLDSLQILKLLLTTPPAPQTQKCSTMVVGCYRSFESESSSRPDTDPSSDSSPPSSMLLQFISDLKKESTVTATDTTTTTLFCMREIDLGNLDVMDCNRILRRLLSIDEADQENAEFHDDDPTTSAAALPPQTTTTTTLPLASLCHRRTLGNPLFLVTFIQLLYEESLLEFNLGTFRWMWDVARIEEETAATI